MLGKEKLDALAAKAFETMEDEAPPEATLGVTMIVAEVRVRHNSESTSTGWYLFSTDGRKWIQRAALQEALEAEVLIMDEHGDEL